ncbi:MAG: hypothetical protein R6W96_02645 [Clostridia bacterium]
MLYEIVHHFPYDMVFDSGGPHISLYQPTHRQYPENRQDSVVFRNLLRKIEHALAEDHKKDFIQSLLKPFYQIEKNKLFWNHTHAGIAVLANREKCLVYHLNTPVKELAVVSDSFHIKPLIKAFQSLERYQLLGLSRNNFSLYQGNRHGFEEIVLDPGVPRTLEEVLGEQLTDPSLTHGSYGGTGGSTMYHGHGDSKEEIEKDMEKYYRHVDRYVLENHSKPSGLPLILVALKEYHSTFKRISHNPYLMEEGIHSSYDSLEMDQLSKKALELIEPLNLEKIRKWTNAYEKAKADSLGSCELAQVLKAAFENRVEALYIEEERTMPGKIDSVTGQMEPDEAGQPGSGDILEDLAEHVLKNSGRVVVLPGNKMPGDTGVAAIFRY